MFVHNLLRTLWRWNEAVQHVILRVLGGSGFANPYFKASRLWGHFFVQKILGINRHVPWPVHWTSVVKCPEKIQPGSGCPGIGHGSYLDGRNGIVFGENVWMACHVKIISMNHDELCYNRYVKEAPVVIGDDCLLSVDSVILPGVTLGKHIIVAAGAVVTKSFPEGNVILAGVPARIIRVLGEYEQTSAGRRLLSVARKGVKS